ncbi:MAG: cobalamin-binding protein [Gammaproteobacteria bacterium]
MIALQTVAAMAADARDTPIRVTDDLDRPVLLSQPARRVVTLSPHLTENLYSVGAGDRLIATIEHSDYPSAVRSVPKLGDALHLDWERLISLKPDLVLVWATGGAGANLDMLTRLGLTAYVSELRRMEDIPRDLENIGRLTGNAEEASQVARAFERDMRLLRSTYADKTPVSVFYALWDKPLMTVGNRQIIHQALSLCGAINVYDDLDALAPVISEESLAVRQPELIVAGAKPEEQAGRVGNWQRLHGVEAIQRGDWLFVDPDNLARPTVRFIDGVRELCEGIDRFRERKGM